MEGLIKGLIDASLGHDNKEEEEEERSRSTWAQENSEFGNEEWDVSGSRPSRRPQKIQTDQWHGYKRAPTEQEYSDEVENGSYLEPTEEELADLSQVCNKLWELDINRLVPGKDYEIDCGDRKKVFQKEDMAQGSLFSWVNENIFQRRTFSRFCSLLDNYNPDEGCKEVVLSEERQEQASFIEEISRTAPVKYLYKYLSSKGIIFENYQDFKSMMTSLWFDLYGRGGTSGSSSHLNTYLLEKSSSVVQKKFLASTTGSSFTKKKIKAGLIIKVTFFPEDVGKFQTPTPSCLQFSLNGMGFLNPYQALWLE